MNINNSKKANIEVVAKKQYKNIENFNYIFEDNKYIFVINSNQDDLNFFNRQLLKLLYILKNKSFNFDTDSFTDLFSKDDTKKVINIIVSGLYNINEPSFSCKSKKMMFQLIY